MNKPNAVEDTSKIEEILSTLVHNTNYKSHSTRLDNEMIDLATAAIERLIAEARIDELSGIQLEYGHYLARTFINGKVMTIEERISALKNQLGDGEALSDKHSSKEDI